MAAENNILTPPPSPGFEEDNQPDQPVNLQENPQADPQMRYCLFPSLNAIVPMPWRDLMPQICLRSVVKGAVKKFWAGAQPPLFVVMVGVMTQLMIMDDGRFFFRAVDGTPRPTFYHAGEFLEV